MGAVARTLGRISGIAASVLQFVPGGQVFAAAFAANALIMGAIGGKGGPDAGGGAPSDVQIGANMPSPYAIGDFYSGGSRIAQVAYGTNNDVPNAFLWAVDVYSVAGPIAAINQAYADFTVVDFDGSGKAIGYFSNDTLFRDQQLGASPEADALAPHFAGAPDWGASYKISNKAAIGWNARYPKDQKRFGSGFPQMGIRGHGVLTWDPRQDGTWPGGLGEHRWAPPSDAMAHAAAQATWSYSGGNPGIEALNYALGRYARTGSNPFRKIFGVGGAIEQIIVADFIELANVCDANGWTANGVIFEGSGISKWDNLKRVLAAGGAVPCFKGGKLGLRFNAPRIPIATITMDDIGEGEALIGGTVAYERRKNTLNPYFVSSDHKWELVPSSPVQVTDYVTADGGERPEDFRCELVTNADQANQLAGYALADMREQPFTLPLFRRWPAGSLLGFDSQVRAWYGIRTPSAVVMKRSIDLNGMRWSADFIGETFGKHSAALSLTGTSPPIPTIFSPEEIDGVVNAGSSVASSFTAIGGVGEASFSFVFPTTPTPARWSYARLLGASTPDIGTAFAIDGGPLTGAAGSLKEGTSDVLDPGTWYLWVAVYDVDDNLLTTSGPLAVTAT